MHALVAGRHYAQDKTAYTHLVVVPAAQQARRGGVDAWVERHWLHGPFVGVALSGPAPEVVRAAAAAQTALQAGSERWPSTRDLSPEDIEATSRRNGALEAIPGPYTPIYPDNTVQILTPDRSVLAELLGGTAARDTRDALLAAGLPTLELATGELYAGRTGALTLTVTALAAHATTYGPGATGGAMSFLSHVEDYLHRSGSAGHREVFERAWRSAPPDLAQTVERLLAGQAQSPLEEAFLQWSRTAARLCAQAYAVGGLPLLPTGPAPEQLSDFHRYVQGRFDPVAVADHFGPYRFATNVLYQLLLTCGVRPVERYLAAYLVSRSVTELTGVDWVALAQPGEHS